MCGFAVLVFAGAAAVAGVTVLAVLLVTVATVCFTCTVPWVHRFLGALTKQMKTASREAAKPAG